MIFNSIDMYHIKLLLTFSFLIIFFVSNYNSRVVLFSVLILWVVGWGTSPYSHTDYINGYLNNLALYSESWLGVEGALSRATDGIRVIEGFGWRFMYFLNSTFKHESTLQIFCGLVQLSAYWFFLKSLGVKGKSFAFAMILLPISSSFTFATDWYLRQGFAWASFLVAVSLFFRPGTILYRYLGFFLFSGLAFIFHSTVFVLISFFILSLILNKAINLKFNIKLSTYSILIILFTISLLIVIPFKFGLLIDLTKVLNYSHLKFYENSAWGPIRPGFIFSFYFFSVFYAIWFSIKIRNKNILILSTFMLFLLFSVFFGIMINSLVSRLLMPFPIISIAVFFSLLSHAKGLNINRFYNVNKFVILFIITIYLIIYYLLIVVGNGGMDRY